jgi:Zn-dependent M28 family amino/carboxypeptidase
MKFLAASALILLAAARAGGPADDGFSRLLGSLSARRIGARIQFLADDLLEGRGTGARGSEIAARYIAAEFAEDGLKPAGDGGTYLQNFDLVGVSLDPAASLALETPKGKIELKNGENCVLSSRAQKPDEPIEAPLVFVGFGIDAPELRWDDYAGVDAAGKLLVCLVGEPLSEDPSFFGGKRLTYYGRWTYKYEEGARRRAAGVLIVHTDELAPYGWQVVRNSWSGEQSQLPLEAGENDLPLAGYLTHDAARRLFADSGLDFDELAAAAGRRGFKAVPLTGSRARGDLRFKLRRFKTENVAGLLEGSDPARRDTAVALTAHFDHLGIGAPDSKGDTIYNGAVDNATGTAALLEMARAAADSRWRPKRSILFLSLTAEEQGLLGSAYAAKHLPVPAGKIAADFNMDSMPVWGKMDDFSLLGIERTTLEPLARGVARKMGLRLDPESHPEQGSYYRSDHFPLAKVGVPAVSVKGGLIVHGHDASYGEKIFEDYNKNHYHQPSDEFDPSWDLSGIVQESQFVLGLTEAISNSAEMPRFKKEGAMTRAEALSK